jgi:hypothetical protein
VLTVGDDDDAVLLAQQAAEGQGQSSLAGSDRSANADGEGALGEHTAGRVQVERLARVISAGSIWVRVRVAAVAVRVHRSMVLGRFVLLVRVSMRVTVFIASMRVSVSVRMAVSVTVRMVAATAVRMAMRHGEMRKGDGSDEPGRQGKIRVSRTGSRAGITRAPSVGNLFVPLRLSPLRCGPLPAALRLA